MTIPEYGLNYDECSDDELSKFTTSRGLEIFTNRAMAREEVIYVLQNADLCATFNLFDLPAEIRNIIYSELLTLRKSDKKEHCQDFQLRQCCWPAILAACKQIKKEAHGLLYDANEFTITVSLGKPQGVSVSSSGQVNALLNDTIVPNLPLWKSVRKQWPTLLTRTKSLKLCLELHQAQKSSEQEVEVNQILRDLHAFLTSSNTLRELHVEISCDFAMQNNHLSDMLSPVCSLSAAVGVSSFKFHQLSAAVAVSIQNTANVLKKIHELEDRMGVHVNRSENLSFNERRLRRALKNVTAPTKQRSELFVLPCDEELKEVPTKLETGLDDKSNGDLRQVVREVMGILNS